MPIYKMYTIGQTYSFNAKECLGRIYKYNVHIYQMYAKAKLNPFHILERAPKGRLPLVFTCFSLYGVTILFLVCFNVCQRKFVYSFCICCPIVHQCLGVTYINIWDLYMGLKQGQYSTVMLYCSKIVQYRAYNTVVLLQ